MFRFVTPLLQKLGLKPAKIVVSKPKLGRPKGSKNGTGKRKRKSKQQTLILELPEE